MFNLIRDNIPALMTANGIHLNYAAVQNEVFFNSLLKAKLIEEVNAYLTAEEEVAFEALVDVKTVLDYLIGDRADEFQKLYDQKIAAHGGYDKKYIEVFSGPLGINSEQNSTED